MVKGPQRPVSGGVCGLRQGLKTGTGAAGVCEGPRIWEAVGPHHEGSYPMRLGAHAPAVTSTRETGRGWACCTCLLLPSCPSSAAICLQGPQASGWAGAPAQAAITLLSADNRTMTQEDTPHIEELPTGKHSLVPRFAQCCWPAWEGGNNGISERS